MSFFDRLSKTLSTGVDRARFEADKFQRTTRISGEITNFKSQVDTNMRQLGERALELYEEGRIDAPEIASLAQIIHQLRDQQTEKENELNEAQNEAFEAWVARQPQPEPEQADTSTAGYGDQAGWPNASSDAPFTTTVADDNTATTTPPFAGASGSDQAAGGAPYACANCGFALPANAAFCPNCGTRVDVA